MCTCWIKNSAKMNNIFVAIKSYDNHVLYKCVWDQFVEHYVTYVNLFCL